MKSKRMKSFLLWALAIVAYYVVFQMFYNMVAFRNVFPYEDASVLLKGIRLNFTPILIIFLIDMLIVLVLTRRMKGTPKILVDLALSLVACFLEDACYLALNNNGYVDWAGTVFNNIFIMLGLEVYYYVKNFKESQRLLARQTQLSLQYQMDALKAQVNPHFLFNSLNILYSLVQIDKKKSLDFILALSDMYRYILQQQDKSKVLVSDELKFLESYVEVLKIRYPDHFHVNITGRENISSQRIVPYTVQLLLENVTKHNVISSDQQMTVDITLSADSLTMCNPIHLKTSASSSHVGLRYMTSLYESHGKKFRTVNDGQTFTAIAPFV